MQVSGTGCCGQSAMARMREQLLDRADSDRSGGLSRDEFAGLAQKGAFQNRSAGMAGGQAISAAAPADSARSVFDSIDSDGNGQITAAELAAARRPENRGGALGTGTFNTLLDSQSESDPLRVASSRRPRPPGADPGEQEGAGGLAEAAAQRLRAAYQPARQPASGLLINA